MSVEDGKRPRLTIPDPDALQRQIEDRSDAWELNWKPIMDGISRETGLSRLETLLIYLCMTVSTLLETEQRRIIPEKWVKFMNDLSDHGLDCDCDHGEEWKDG